jgi:hypothetical protein
MGVYVYSKQQIEQIIARNKRFRLRFCFLAAATLIAILFAVFYRPAWVHSILEWLIPIAIAIIAMPFFNNIRRWKSAPQRWEQTLAGRKVDVSSDGVCLWSSSGTVRRFERNDIRCAEEPTWGGGLYLRSPNRYRWMLIPKSICQYESIKRELAGMGIQLVATSIPPNWEEFVFVLLFIGTMLCDVTVQSTRVLFANLIVSVLLSIVGFLVIGANPDNPQIRNARIGVFIPVVFAMLAIWFATSGW